jgi:ElaB/YqjD/DUF883 family membrane-anchored ribosome-binding protein
MTTMTSSSLGPESTISSFDEPRSGDINAERRTSGSAAIDSIASGAHQAVDRIASAANSAANQLSISGGDLAAAKDRWMQSCGAFVKDNPLTALGIAAAAGFLLSRWVR